MKVAILSDHEILGGAAVATSRLAEALAERVELTRIVLHPEGSKHPWQTVTLPREETWFRRQISRFPRKFLPGRFPRPGTPEFHAKELARVLRKLRPDIINVHNLHTGSAWGWSPELVRVAVQFAPVVWTLHDQWSFTGRCAYAYDCERFCTGCDASCPTPHEEPRLTPAAIAPAWKARQTLFRELPSLVAVTPSRWLAKEAARGFWQGHRIEVIPYGVPLHRFVPIERNEARCRLKLQASGPILLLAAQDLSERRKGGELLPRLAATLAESKTTLLTMGVGSLDLPGVAIHRLGWLERDADKSLAYSAADALLHLAPVDNFPNVILEALACGTPTIALPIGGIPEMIRPGLTGNFLDPVRLDDSLRAILRDFSLSRDACRRSAIEEYSLARQASRYLALFTEEKDRPIYKT